MPNRGSLSALTGAQRAKLLALKNDQDRVNFVLEDLEETWDEDWNQDTDKAWSIIAEVLDDPPLDLCILGGRAVLEDEGDDPEWIIRLVEPDQVKTLVEALKPIDRDAFLARYAEKCLGLTAAERAEEPDLSVYEDDDFVYGWDCFEAVKAFYARVAGSGRAVLFTVDR